METVKDIMTTDVFSVSDDWSPESLSQFFFDKQVSGAPVIDKHGNLVGVVSLSFLRLFNPDHQFLYHWISQDVHGK